MGLIASFGKYLLFVADVFRKPERRSVMYRLVIKEIHELGLKSVLFVELIARGGKKDIHSLNFPLVPSPPWELVHALSTIMTRDRKILIKDWYEGLYELGEEEINLLNERKRN